MNSNVLRGALCAVTALVGVHLSSTAAAVKYMSLEQAVKTFTPKGSKIVKVTKTPSAAQRQRLLEDYGWKAEEPSYVFYVGRSSGGEDLAYVFVVPEVFGTCFHKYAIGMDAAGVVQETVIVELSCPRSFPINKKGFLKQFRKKTHQDPLTVKADVDSVTGATYSAEATATATRKAVSLHNLFFGGGAPVAVSEDVRKARAAVQAQIQKAIESGELLTDEEKAAKAGGK
ncbi:MAG: hypothetical protein ABIJ09_11100 [Pseudomonadota bacterium]